MTFMKLYFFGDDNNKPKLSEHLIIYILSLLDPKSQSVASLVNKDWSRLVQLTRQYLSMLPVIHRIPLFANLGLDVLKLKLMTGGMTNSTFRLRIKNAPEKWVMRIPGIGSSAFITRRDEAHNAKQAEKLGLNVPIAFFDPEDGLQVTRFIEGVHSLDDKALARKEILHEVASMMRRLHKSPPFDNNTLFFERNEELLDLLKRKPFNFPGEIEFIEQQMKNLKEIFSSYRIQQFPCHNDTTPLNFILSENPEIKGSEKIHQIDWEYSSNNDFIWDLVYFMVEAKLNREQQLILLKAYFNTEELSGSLLAWIEVYKPIIEWWITIWSWTQLANGANAVDLSSYEQLGLERYHNTLSHLKSEGYVKALALIETDSHSLTFTGQRPF
ncbi:TPA: phosphotransferase [Legionella pneumophila]|nr:phosphotransferase [Legionella pneumophila]HAT8860975.1 phosphotransferase [Legionella pneumophila subsp. pneumophila]HAT6827680.1 phosphotransferase [Legionella pneumophila]HAT6893376.1 phosphotransferase [Legionella pneumophila]HAT6989392.1 phosphotransferase [Legionella pneumophila]